MAYGTIKVNNITFDNSGSDQNVTVSGLYNSLTSGITVTGTISGAVVIGSTSVSGTSVAGVTGTFTSGIIASGTAAAPSLTILGDLNTGIFSPGADQLAVATNGVERVEFGTSEVVFNNGGANVDFRVEGDTNPNLFKIDAGTDQVQVANLNGGPLAGMRNAIINGNFDHWQRGTSFTGAEYTSDRWISNRTGTTHTATRQAFTVGQTAVPGEPTYFFRTVVTSVAGAGNAANFIQRIEDVRTFAGQQVTVSFWAKADATKNIAVDLAQSFGTGGSPSAIVTSIGTTKVSIGTTFQKVTVTTTIPSISGKTLGSNNDHSLILSIFFDAGSNFNARTDSLGQQSGTFEIAQVQIEAGPVATPFERRPIGTELALCQRYFASFSAAIDGRSGATLENNSYSYPFFVEMRVAPTLTHTSLATTNCTTAADSFPAAQNKSFRYRALATVAGVYNGSSTVTASAEL